jgi:glycosyltransferase involved in cell wall biosynthesis
MGNMGNETVPLVSVSVITYNHEKYIRQCLDGILMQNVNFPYEVLVHDDASPDGTADIIREYEAKYPDIIKPIYQTENQYSQGRP